MGLIKMADKPQNQATTGTSQASGAPTKPPDDKSGSVMEEEDGATAPLPNPTGGKS